VEKGRGRVGLWRNVRSAGVRRSVREVRNTSYKVTSTVRRGKRQIRAMGIKSERLRGPALLAVAPSPRVQCEETLQARRGHQYNRQVRRGRGKGRVGKSDRRKGAKTGERKRPLAQPKWDPAGIRRYEIRSTFGMSTPSHPYTWMQPGADRRCSVPVCVNAECTR
jgi:hypothetical protein